MSAEGVLTADRRSALIAAMPWVFVLIWSTGFVVARVAMPHSPPFSFLVVRFALSALCFAVWIALAGVSSPTPSFFQTTSVRPARPRRRPSHWRDVARPPPVAADVRATHTAVSTGCRPTSSATVPAPTPARTADQTPPR